MVFIFYNFHQFHWGVSPWSVSHCLAGIEALNLTFKWGISSFGILEKNLQMSCKAERLFS